ncbi:MAG: hypothetical protein LDL41_00970, partial [Coleofasciculus sp. S288]|nr:hypothetical protein [Coleofasciculus sp. S288]
MISQKQGITIFSLVWLLNACTAQNNPSSQALGEATNCPTESSSLPISPTTSKEGESFYDRFDYHIRNIVDDTNTVTFQTDKYDFVFCRGNNSWTVKPGTLPTELQQTQNGAEYHKQLENPPYKTISFNEKLYQYRVVIDPNPFPIDEQKAEAQKVVFELITPDNKPPQRQTLYTLDQLRQANVGNNLGVPRVTAALNSNNRLFFSVASEQGEGFSGIATIVNYDPQKNETIIIQPEAIKRQQITDLVITGDAANPTFWMGMQTSGEGNSYLPGMGLVAYRPNPQNFNSGSVKFYNVNNSPLVGAIPDKLKLEDDTLWVGTGNGICQVKWQAADNPGSWSCNRFALLTRVPAEGIPFYSSSTSKNPATTLTP